MILYEDFIKKQAKNKIDHSIFKIIKLQPKLFFYKIDMHEKL